MKKKPKLPPRVDWDNVVPHPRYGSRPVASGVTGVTERQIRDGYWAYRDAHFFPETVLLADVAKQHFTNEPRRYYVDLLETCRKCGRLFLFFAQEQKYWYESLGFYVDARCVLCPECRQQEHRLRDHVRAYQHLNHSPELTDDELVNLASSTAALWQSGFLRDDQTLRRIRNLARRRIPDRAAAKALDALVIEIDGGNEN